MVVDVSNPPVWGDEEVRDFFVTSTRNLLAADIGHLLAVTIVGAERLPDSGYLRAKVAQEAEIAAGPVPYTILRATQFFEFLPDIVEAGDEFESVRLPVGSMSPLSSPWPRRARRCARPGSSGRNIVPSSPCRR